MTWNDITVFQWQQLAQLNVNDLDETELSIKTISIITGKTDMQVRAMPFDEIMKLADRLKFLQTEIPTQKVDVIKVGKKRYKVNYDIKNSSISRYIEVKHFVQDFANNIHKIAASMVVPMEPHYLIGYQIGEYDVNKHEQYADDLLSASISEVMGSIVFFYLVYRTWIKVFKDYLKQQMMAKGMTQEMAELFHQTLCSSLDGFTRLPLSLNITGLNLTKHLN